MSGKLINIDIDTRGLSKPATKFIDVVAQGIGGLYKPISTVLQAKAEAKARLITAEADVELMNIAKRSVLTSEHLNYLNQRNIESVLALAVNELPTDVSDEPVEYDWINQYFEYVKNVTDEDMQILWARILAGEIEKPGNYSKRLLSFIKTLEKKEAMIFSKVCSFVWTNSNNRWPFIFMDDYHRKKYDEYLDEPGYLSHFGDVGLFAPMNNTLSREEVLSRGLTYFDESFIFTPVEYKKNDYYNTTPFIMVCEFSSIGKQLWPIANTEKIKDKDYIPQALNAINSELKISNNI